MPDSPEYARTATIDGYRRAAARLGLQRDAASCEAVCRHALDAIDAAFAAHRADGAAIACASGCTFCCHLRVTVFVHEAIALLHHLRTSIPAEVATSIKDRITANAREVDGLSVREHYAARLPCAFLVDGRCAAYRARPSACARYHSLSRARCEHAYEHPQHAGTPSNSRPALLELQALGAEVDRATESALEDAGLSTTKVEVHQLLRALLENPSAIERWLAGDEPLTAGHAARA